MRFVRTTSTATLFLLFGTIAAYAQRDEQNEKQGKPERQQEKQERGAPPQQARGQQQQNQPQEQRGQPARQPQQRVQQTQQQRPQQQPQLGSQQVQRQSQRTQQRQSAEQPRQERRQQPQVQQQQQQQRIEQGQQRPQEERSHQAWPQQLPHRTEQQAAAWQHQRGWIQQGGWQGNSTWQQGRAQRWDDQHRTWAQRGGYGGYYIPQDRFSLYFGHQHWFRMYGRPTIYMGYPRFSYGGFSFMLVDPWPEYWAENWYDTDDVYIDYDDGYYLYNRRSPSVRLAITVAM